MTPLHIPCLFSVADNTNSVGNTQKDINYKQMSEKKQKSVGVDESYMQPNSEKIYFEVLVNITARDQ